MSASGRSTFYKVATKEDDYTQLLCNLMQRPEGRDFRTAVLSLLLGDPLLALSIEPEQISTQIIFPGAGRPDLVITSSTMIAAIEVKITRHRSCTDNQDLSDDSLDGYWGFLKEAPKARKILSLVVPRDWKYLEENRNGEMNVGGVMPQLTCLRLSLGSKSSGCPSSSRAIHYTVSSGDFLSAISDRLSFPRRRLR
jgi:hypothetical protein